MFTRQTMSQVNKGRTPEQAMSSELKRLHSAARFNDKQFGGLGTRS